MANKHKRQQWPPNPVPQAKSSSGVDALVVMAQKLGPTLDSMRQTVLELKDLLAEGRALLRDLEAERKKAERVLPMIVANRVRDEIADRVEKELVILSDETRAAAEQLVKQYREDMGKRFDEINAMLMGEEDDGQLSLVELLDRLGPLVPVIRATLGGDLNVARIKQFRAGTLGDEFVGERTSNPPAAFTNRNSQSASSASGEA